MLQSIRRSPVFAGQWACLLVIGAAPLSAEFPKVIYTLQAGSSVTDDCLCGRPPLQVPISGSFVLQRSEVKILGELYGVSDMAVSCAECPPGAQYSLNGEGTYYLRNPETQTGHLELVLDGGPHVLLDAAEGAVAAPWPLIDVTFTEDGTRDAAQKLTIRIIAAPQVDLQPYQLVKGNLEDSTGTILEIVCLTCRLLHSQIPLEGTMQVGLTALGVDAPSTYRIDAIDWRDLLTDVDYAITGSGSYQEGGDAEVTREARLVLGVNSPLDLHELSGGPVAVKPGEGYPNLKIDLEEKSNDVLWYRLHLEARPTSTVKFRRGDVNADGVLDISDPIFYLAWQFAAGPETTCREAADSATDGVLDLTDAVYTLQYLFLAGPPPPAPGPFDCGAAPEARFGCDSYPPCAPGA